MAGFVSDAGIALPDDHQALLSCTNGLEVYGGYYRVFGIPKTEGVDSVWWNQPETWKFAWKERCSEFWCFGESAWGDQYAYRQDWRDGRSEVYILDALAMSPRRIASSFAEFLETEVLRCAREPYDAVTVAVRRKLGPLLPTESIVYVPSVVIGGSESPENVMKMGSRLAMVCNGDIAIQVGDAPANSRIKQVQVYEDAMQRTRLRLVWT